LKCQFVKDAQTTKEELRFTPTEKLDAEQNSTEKKLKMKKKKILPILTLMIMMIPPIMTMVVMLIPPNQPVHQLKEIAPLKLPLDQLSLSYLFWPSTENQYDQF
jgi:hypothetical protein